MRKGKRGCEHHQHMAEKRQVAITYRRILMCGAETGDRYKSTETANGERDQNVKRSIWRANAGCVAKRRKIYTMW